MNRVVLQIPLDKSLRMQAERAAEEQGFSTLQDFTRLIYRKLVAKRLDIRVGEPPIQLSPWAIRRYKKIDDDYRKGKNIYTAHSVEELMKQLNES